jgi:hypothetical protein
MIPVEKLEEIRALLAEGKLSQRAIARKVGVSRGTVAAIASRKRPCYERRLAEDPSATSRRRGRCPTCRAIVLLPCLACLVRQLLAPGALRPLPPCAEEPLRLELRPAEFRRYLQVRLRRQIRQEI